MRMVRSLRAAFVIMLTAAAVVLALPSGASAQASGTVYLPGQLTKLPHLTSVQQAARLIERSYPPAMKNQGIGGTVQIQVVVGPDGSVDPASVKVLSATAPQLGSAAKSVAAQLKFEPGAIDGRPVAVRVIVPVVYKTS